ncbi:MAG: hypothetical protein IPN08_06495 [Bacteroidales bacterium]|nr:hypothetical protein [Bacteroidales bacterium]
MANRQRRIDEEIQRIKNEENRMVQEAVDKYMKAYNKDQETKKLREAEELRLKKEQEEKDQFEKKKLEQIEKEKQEREREIKWAKIERENEQKAEIFNFLINIVNLMISNSAKPKP